MDAEWLTTILWMLLILGGVLWQAISGALKGEQEERTAPDSARRSGGGVFRPAEARLRHPRQPPMAGEDLPRVDGATVESGRAGAERTRGVVPEPERSPAGSPAVDVVNGGRPAPAHHVIPLLRSALPQAVIMSEVLAPPRARRPFRPTVRWR